MNDRLALAHVIEDAGIPRDKAENIATAIARFIEGSAATKAERAESISGATSSAEVLDFLRTQFARVNARLDRIERRLLLPQEPEERQKRQWRVAKRVLADGTTKEYRYAKKLELRRNGQEARELTEAAVQRVRANILAEGGNASRKRPRNADV